ncbi:glycosyltransferase [Helicobacter sp. XJK30-2]|uniref:Glycosyltransferase n=1 Tax=Helicobacter zhangjianzhongii TaxID=2974574 RepID=A0ACC6FQJ3_9HELI|nr:ATP-grasp fold amidoligase family protein [Helicobacter sp. XJK30-2]MDL0081465.1 glycosyltransferase [Helicobacter sp. XJK30-2]
MSLLCFGGLYTRIHKCLIFYPYLANDDFHNKIARNPESYKAPTDYKCHIFNGALSHIDTIIDKFTNQTEIAMTPTWEKMPFDYDKKASHIPKKPKNLTLMQELAISLADKFSYVRVDLYEIDEQIIVGELTFTPTGGTDRFSPMQWDRNLGDLWV